MGQPDLFSITVYYANSDRLEEIDAYNVTRTPNGNLSVEGNKADWLFPRGSWESYEMRPLDPENSN